MKTRTQYTIEHNVGQNNWRQVFYRGALQNYSVLKDATQWAQNIKAERGWNGEDMRIVAEVTTVETNVVQEAV